MSHLWNTTVPIVTADELRVMAREQLGDLFVALQPSEAERLRAEVPEFEKASPKRMYSYRIAMLLGQDKNYNILADARFHVSRDGRIGDRATLLPVICASDRPVVIALRFGADEPTYEREGSRRGKIHSIQNAGITNAARVAAFANLLTEYAIQRVVTKKPSLSAATIIAFAREDSNLRFAVDRCMRFRSEALQGSVGALCLYAVAQAGGHAQATSFLSTERCESEPTKGWDPVDMLRFRLINDRQRRKPERRDVIVGWCLEAVAFHLMGKPWKEPVWRRGVWPRLPGFHVPEIIQREAARIRSESDGKIMAS